MITYSQACLDPNLFGPWFEGPSWNTWRVLDKAMFGEPLSGPELETFTQLTGRTEAPTEPATEVFWVFGRRGGKDVKAASYATYLSTIGAELYGYRQHLTRGERGVVQILAVDRDQAKVCFNYVKSFFEQPMLARLVRGMSSDTIELDRISIEVTTSDKRRVRGRTVIACVMDELAHWRNEQSVNPDEDIYQAVRPSMLTIPNALLIGISSPYSRKGLLWRKFSENWAKPGSILVARAPTWLMNPTQPRDHPTIVDAYERDPAWAAGEYGAEWREDIESIFNLDAVMACIQDGVRERAPERRNKYVAFCDAAGGSGADSYTLCIAHRAADTCVVDCIREAKPKFSPESITDEFADLCRRYRITRVLGDKFGGEMPREIWRRYGLNYEVETKTKSDLYISLLPLVNSGAVDLLESQMLVRQLVALERRVQRGGKGTVDHPPGGHDDVANAVAGAVVAAMTRQHPRAAWEHRPLRVEGVARYDALRQEYR